MAEDTQQQTSAITSRANTVVAKWQDMQWTPERKELVRKSIAPGASELELTFFFEWCSMTGLNPFLKQSYLIPRRAQVNGAWVDKFEPMVAEAGFAARADALPDFRGMNSGVVYAGDVFGIDFAAGIVVHEMDLATRAKFGNKVIGAWAHAKRDGREIEVTWLTFESRVQLKKKEGGNGFEPTKFWANDPAGQMRKCARADQYRRGWPNIFGGWYSDAENPNDEREVNAPPAPPAAPDGKSQALKDRLKAKAKTVDGEKAAPAAKASPPTAAKAGAPPIDCLRYGPLKGKKIADATTIELEEAQKVALDQIAKASGKETWFANVREGIVAVDNELARRQTSDVEPPADLDDTSSAPEPGSDG